MATKPALLTPYFYIFDFYLMKGSNDSNDIVPVAILYFYPIDEEAKKQRLLDCSGMVGVIQYFQHDLFNSVARTFYLRKSYIAHEHYGRHSAFLCVPDDRYTAEEARFYLDHILNTFSMLYGTWNHVQSTYDNIEEIKKFLNRALTPIINYVLNHHRTFANLFATIEYTPLKNGTQRVLLDGKHFLGHLKSHFGVQDGFLGYLDKILYSSCDSKTTFYLQLLFQLKTEISEGIVIKPWEKKFRLPDGVSIYHIYLPQPTVPTPATEIAPSKSVLFPMRERANSKTVKSKSIDIVIDAPTASDDEKFSSSSVPKTQPHRLSVPTMVMNRKHPSLVVFRDRYGSSEETGFDTDTADEGPSDRKSDPHSSLSLSENDKYPTDLATEDSDSGSSSNVEEGPAESDDVKLQRKNDERSRSSTVDEERGFDKTVRESSLETPKLKTDGPAEQIRFVAEPLYISDDEEETFRAFVRERTPTMTTGSEPNTKEYKNEVQVSWKDIPDHNNESERDHYILYVQRNSGMMFAGMIEESLITDDYIHKLWKLIISKFAEMVTEIQVIQSNNEVIRSTTDVKFNFNEETHLAKFERVFDGVRYSRRIPSEESTAMSFYARTQLNRDPQRTVIGLFRGTHFVSIDRTLPDRLKCSCGRSQETL